MRNKKQFSWPRCGNILRQLCHELLVEFSHLNSARIGDVNLSRLPRSERVRTVKAALAKHHSKGARCC